MSKILISGAGGTPSENVIKSILACPYNEEIIGMGSEPDDLILSLAHKKYIVPYSIEKTYRNSLLNLFNIEKPDLAYFQNDTEIFEASKLRDDIIKSGVRLYMPTHDVVDNCVHKFKSYAIWQKEGIKVPKTILIRNEQDLKMAFETLSNRKGMIWLRSIILGGGGKGALPTNDFTFAKMWINQYKGWGHFTAAELLTPKTVTWLSIWYRGELVVAQTRRRKSWGFGNRTLSGVTGITKVGETYSCEIVTRVAQDSILSIDKNPHGIYGVDMTYDENDIPNPTEINVARFFTTVYFFTKAGLNMPKIFKDIALYEKFPSIKNKINPLPNGLLWVRGMDREPILTTKEGMSKEMKAI